MFDARPAQRQILEYTRGRMGIAAVPGSGKTHTLSALAAQIIRNGSLEEDQEVLVVTLVNSAVENFNQRVEQFLDNTGNLPGFQYRVRTLHGLANDIIRERPSIAGLANDYTILDERDTTQIISQAVIAWYRSHIDEIESYLDLGVAESYLYKVRKTYLPDLLSDIATAFIRTVKDMQLTTEDVIRMGDEVQHLPDYQLIYMCSRIYQEYDRALHYRGAVDFDDLIRLALFSLRQDEQLLLRLRLRWPYILEDEAQDSSRLQQEILGLLSGVDGNWVRVGDPNQAIYATFTTANPQYLRDFIHKDPSVTARTLPDSGRSTQGIIDLANHIIEWTRAKHPIPEVRNALDLPLISPVPPGDSNPNPPDSGTIIRVLDTKLAPDQELVKVAESISRWLPDNQEKTVAVLCSQNKHLENLADVFKTKNIPYIELLRSTSASRKAASRLDGVIKFISSPRTSAFLAAAFKSWRSAVLNSEDLTVPDEETSRLLVKCTFTEDYLYPQMRDWLAELPLEEKPQVENLLREFRPVAQTWLDAANMPIDELILFLSQELFVDIADLAVAHKIAALLRGSANIHPEWRLLDFSREVADFCTHDRKFTGFSDQDSGFDPTAHKGKVVLSTMHKSKGLEWDRVYLTALNNYDFPSGAEGDEYFSERWFLRNKLNLQAEVLSQLENAAKGNTSDYIEGEATRVDRLHLISERMRLLFVGITRARMELLLSWNTGQKQKSTEALALIEIKDYLTFNNISPDRREN
jgi:DNA helicase-2/ATP-dependent DNA helicase PcrA